MIREFESHLSDMLISIYGKHECPHCGFVDDHVGQFREHPQGEVMLDDTPVSKAWECRKCQRWWFNTLAPIDYVEGEFSALAEANIHAA